MAQRRIWVVLIGLTLFLTSMFIFDCSIFKQQEVSAMTFSLSSPAFTEGKRIPDQHTCQGADHSPVLQWNDPPKGTVAFALICDDPDAPVGTWVHWVIFNLPGSARNLPENVPKIKELADGSRQGTNDFSKIGYNGPCPPRGSVHRYFFKLYALSKSLNISAGVKKSDVLKAMEGSVLASAQLVGTYSR